MIDQTKNILIGLFVVAAFCIVVFILLFLHPSMGDEGQILQVRFANIDKINVGTRVLFAGHPVGEVKKIQEIPQARESDVEGQVYIFELTLEIDSGVQVYTTDDISAKTSGLLGEKSIAITPQPQVPGTKLILVTNQILYASSPESVEDVMRNVSNLSKKAEVLLVNFNDVVVNVKQEEIIKNLGDTMRNFKQITQVLDRGALAKIIANAQQFTEGINAFQGKLNGSWVHIEDAILNLKQAMKDLDLAIVGGKVWIEGLSDSKGTFHKIFHEEDLYLRLTAMMSKGETVLDDMNHYGLLYQNDKNWQRMRARKVNLLQKLRCPQEFRNFFNDEIDEIITSLSRVHMVLQEADELGYCSGACFPEFTTVFSDLLRRVTGLEKNVKLYNTQAVQLKAECCEQPWPICWPCSECSEINWNDCWQQ